MSEQLEKSDLIEEPLAGCNHHCDSCAISHDHGNASCEPTGPFTGKSMAIAAIGYFIFPLIATMIGAVLGGWLGGWLGGGYPALYQWIGGVGGLFLAMLIAIIVCRLIRHKVEEAE